MSVERLIEFLDWTTKNGSDSAILEYWQEDIGIQNEEILLLNSFTTNDWKQLEIHLQNKSNLWIECLLYLLDETELLAARKLIINIALNGTDENFLDAMEHIRDFQQDVPKDIWLQLQACSSSVLKKRLLRVKNDKTKPVQ